MVHFEPATLQRMEALAEGDEVFTERFGIPVVSGWARFPESIPQVVEALRGGDPGPWGTHLFFDDDGSLVGFGGWKGPPVDGVTELGYAVAAQREGQGIATAAVGELLGRARMAGLRVAVAHTLAASSASTTVLERCGFTQVGESTQPEVGAVWRWELALGADPETETQRLLARHLAEDAIERGELLSWFEELYVAAETQGGRVPWADGVPNPHLVAWAQHNGVRGGGAKALVIGCGLGDDAEYLAAIGFTVVAFDVAPTAVRQCRERFPSTAVEYVVADLLEPPQDWARAFEFVFEANTLQALPPGAFRDRAIQRLSTFVSETGTLVVVARGRDDDEPVKQVPWPLTRTETLASGAPSLTLSEFRDFYDDESPPVRRFMATFTAAAARPRLRGT